MRQLRRFDFDWYVFEIVVFVVEIDLLLGQRLLDDGVSLDIHRRRSLRIDAEIPQLVRRGAAADADLEPASAEMVEHADLFGEPQRVMGGQDINQRAQAETPRTLRRGSEKYAGRWCEIERRRMMLAHMIGPKSGLVVELDQLQTVFVLFGKR